MAAITLSRFGRFALDLMYPPACALCGRGGSLLCVDCEATFRPADGIRCSVCWLPLLAQAGCRHCLENPLALAALRSAYRYEGLARALVHSFKFRDLSSLAEVMAPQMASMVDWPVEAVVPVPLARSRERERGYNQSMLLARGVGAALGVPGDAALKRVRAGQPQVKSPSRAQRWRNVLGAFALRNPRLIEGRAVLLIDDVATTGATLDACARTLLEGGAREVSGVTYARDEPW